MRTIHALVPLPFVALAALAPAARARQGGQFDQVYEDGIAAFRSGKHQDALIHFKRAAALEPGKVGPQRWLAATYQALRRYEDCIASAIQAVRVNPYAGTTKETLGYLAACRQALGRPGLAGELPTGQGAICVITEESGAAVIIDDIRRGATPLAPLPVNPGVRHVRVELRGHLPYTATVEVMARVVHDVVARPVRDPNAKPDVVAKPRRRETMGWLAVATNVGTDARLTVDGRPVTPSADGALKEAPGIHVLQVEADGYEVWRRRVIVAREQKRAVTAHLRTVKERTRYRVLGYLALGAAAAAASGGAAFGILESRAYFDARRMAALERKRPVSSALPEGLPESAVHTWQDIADLESKGRRYAVFSNLSFGAAIVAAGAGCYFLIRERGAERRGYELPLALVPTVSPGGRAGAQLVFTQELGR